MDQIEVRATEVFRDVFDDESLNLFDTMTMDDVEEWDSLSHTRLIVSLEMEFGIRFQTTEVNDTKNVGELLRLIENKSSS